MHREQIAAGSKLRVPAAGVSGGSEVGRDFAETAEMRITPRYRLFRQNQY